MLGEALVLAIVPTSALGCGPQAPGNTGPPSGTPGHHAESGVCLANQIGPLTSSKFHDFGPGDVGVSLTEAETRFVVTLYAYPAGGSPPTDADLDEHFRELVQEMSKSVQSRGRFTLVSFDSPRFERPGRGATTQGELDGVPVESVVYLFTKDRWYFKVRATYPQASGKRSRELTDLAAKEGFTRCH